MGLAYVYGMIEFYLTIWRVKNDFADNDEFEWYIRLGILFGLFIYQLFALAFAVIVIIWLIIVHVSCFRIAAGFHDDPNDE